MAAKSKSKLDKIAEDLRNAPYAYHDAQDVERWIAKLDTPEGRASVTSALESDACTHDECWNYAKAAIVRKLARRVHNLR
jgi:hypothetical protein